jgi:hypothetical protein
LKEEVTLADELTMEQFLAGQEAPAPAPAEKKSPYQKAPWFETYKQLRDNPVPDANAPTDPAERDRYFALLAKNQHAAQAAPAQNRFSEAVDRQGGWGISPETRASLGADDSAGGTFGEQVLRPIRNAPANIADLGARALQGLQVGFEGTAKTVDDVVDATGINEVVKKYTGREFHPGDAALALAEAFPAGGLETGLAASFARPKGSQLTEELQTRFNNEAKALFDSGATKEQMNAWAKDRGMTPFGEDLDKAIAARQVEGPALPEGVPPAQIANDVTKMSGLADEAANFKTGIVEPKATDLFPTDASRAADAEAWGQKLGAPASERPVVADPIPAETVLPEEAPALSRKDAEALFKQETATPETQTPKEWGKSLEEQAAQFKEGRTPVEDLPPRQQVADAVVNKPIEPRTVEGKPAPETPTAEVVTRLTDALNTAAKVNAKVQGRLYSAARAERLKSVAAVRNSTSGEAGLRAEMAQLRGPLPKAEFEPVRAQFKQEEIDGLFNHLRDNPQLSMFDQINARTGLAKLLDGSVPTKSEINLLDRAFPQEFVQAALKNRTFTAKTLDAVGNVLNLPRSLMSTFDLSAPFRQGVFLVGRKEFWNGFQSMFKQFGSEKAFNGVMDSIRSHPNYPWMEESKLALTDIGHSLTTREEAFASQWAERIPVLGKGVKASERAYTGFLNKVRADTFNTILEQTKAAGIDIVNNPKAVNDIASFVNNATGRGSLGPLSQAGPVLNGLFFSPRLIASRATMLNPAYYATLSPIVRKEAIKSLLAFGGLATTITGLAAAGGASVETDPRSSDFAKIRNGKTRFDILGGFGQYLTLGARLATNETKTMKGEIQTLGQRYGSANRLDVMIRFATNKESPVASFVTDYLRGKNAVGEPFEARQAALQRMLPLFWQDLAEVTKDEGLVGAMKVAPGMFGVGVQTYDEPVSRDAFMSGQAAVTPKDEAPKTPEPEAPVIKDTLSAEDFLKGSEVK